MVGFFIALIKMVAASRDHFDYKLDLLVLFKNTTNVFNFILLL